MLFTRKQESPKNPFLRINTHRNPEVMENLLKDLDHQFYVISLPADVKAEMVEFTLKKIQRILEKFREFGWNEVSLMNENDFSDLIEALVTLKRAGLENEIKNVVGEILQQCLSDLFTPSRYLPAELS